MVRPGFLKRNSVANPKVYLRSWGKVALKQTLIFMWPKNLNTPIHTIPRECHEINWVGCEYVKGMPLFSAPTFICGLHYPVNGSLKKDIKLHHRDNLMAGFYHFVWLRPLAAHVSGINVERQNEQWIVLALPIKSFPNQRTHFSFHKSNIISESN